MPRIRAVLVAATLAVGLLTLAGPAHADTTTALCTNTTYVDGSTKQTKSANYGSSTDLVAKNEGTTFALLECVVSGIPSGASVSSATLDVFSRSVNTPHTIEERDVTTSWVENSVTWNTRPVYSATVRDSKPGDLVSGAGEWVNLNASNVTGNGTYRYALTTPSTTEQRYASDDYTFDTTRRPRITVTWTPAPVAPIASFTANPTSGTVPLTAAFTDTSTGSPTSWLWDFGDGSTSTVQSPSHTYSTVGTFTVTLTASNAAGSSTASQTVTVSQVPAPTASFTATPTSGQAPLLVQFTDTSTGSPTAWLWDFGDGGTSTEQNPAHTYSTAGTYTVTLTASNAGGSSSASTTITVSAAPPPGPNWLVAFDDQFNDGVVPSHWTRYSGPNGSNDPSDCSDPNLWSVSGGSLILPFRYQTSGPCGATWYNASGMDNSAAGKSVDQKIVIRWRLTGTVLPHYVIPMRWDADPNYEWYNLEQDLCERPSGVSTFDRCQTHNHYQSTSPCCIDSPLYTVDLTQWHTWEFTSYQNRITTTIDGVLWWDYQGDNTTVPPGLRRDVLQVECKTTCPTDTSLTAQAEVDYMTTYYPS